MKVHAHSQSWRTESLSDTRNVGNKKKTSSKIFSNYICSLLTFARNNRGSITGTTLIRPLDSTFCVFRYEFIVFLEQSVRRSSIQILFSATFTSSRKTSRLLSIPHIKSLNPFKAMAEKTCDNAAVLLLSLDMCLTTDNKQETSSRRGNLIWMMTRNLCCCCFVEYVCDLHDRARREEMFSFILCSSSFRNNKIFTITTTSSNECCFKKASSRNKEPKRTERKEHKKTSFHLETISSSDGHAQ